MAKPGKSEKWAGRSARLSAALRENLKRRKEQARGRRRAPGPDGVQEIGNETGQASPSPEAETGVSPEFRRNPVRE
jgi:hypothetical protein